MGKDQQNSPEPQKCIICGETDTKITRGLCRKHYGRFQRAASRILPEALEEYEAKLIEGGFLLPSKPPGLQVDLDVFAEIAAEFPSKPTDEQLVEKTKSLGGDGDPKKPTSAGTKKKGRKA